MALIIQGWTREMPGDGTGSINPVLADPVEDRLSGDTSHKIAQDVYLEPPALIRVKQGLAEALHRRVGILRGEFDQLFLSLTLQLRTIAQECPPEKDCRSVRFKLCQLLNNPRPLERKPGLHIGKSRISEPPHVGADVLHRDATFRGATLFEHHVSVEESHTCPSRIRICPDRGVDEIRQQAAHFLGAQFALTDSHGERSQEPGRNRVGFDELNHTIQRVEVISTANQDLHNHLRVSGFEFLHEPKNRFSWAQLRKNQTPYISSQQGGRSPLDGLLEDHLTTCITFVDATQGKAQPLGRSRLVAGEPVQMRKQPRRVRPNPSRQFVGLVGLSLGIIGESFVPWIAGTDDPQFPVEIGRANRIDP